MGNGIYGENQGNETRAAGRHNGDIIRAEAIATEQSPKSGNGMEIEHMRVLFNLGGMDSLAKYAKMLVKEWGDTFLPPTRENGEPEKRYTNRVARAQSAHYHAVLRKVQGMVSQATRGESAMLRSEGGSFRYGEKITPDGRPIINKGGDKADWTLPLPVAAYVPPK